LIIIP